MLTSAVPLLVSVTVCDCLAPTFTLPKASLAGLVVSWPSAVPVPTSEMFVIAFDASLVTLTVAVKAPTAFGVNLTLRVTL